MIIVTSGEDILRSDLEDVTPIIVDYEWVYLFVIDFLCSANVDDVSEHLSAQWKNKHRVGHNLVQNVLKVKII